MVFRCEDRYLMEFLVSFSPLFDEARLLRYRPHEELGEGFARWTSLSASRMRVSSKFPLFDVTALIFSVSFPHVVVT